MQWKGYPRVAYFDSNPGSSVEPSEVIIYIIKHIVEETIINGGVTMPDEPEFGPGFIPGEKGEIAPIIEFSVLLDRHDSSCRKLLDDIELELETMMPGTILKAIGGCRCAEEVRRLCDEISDDLFSMNQVTDETCEYYIRKGG